MARDTPFFSNSGSSLDFLSTSSANFIGTFEVLIAIYPSSSSQLQQLSQRQQVELDSWCLSMFKFYGMSVSIKPANVHSEKKKYIL